MKSARISVEVISILMVLLMVYQVIASGNDTNTMQNNNTLLSENSEELTKDDYNCRKKQDICVVCTSGLQQQKGTMEV